MDLSHEFNNAFQGNPWHGKNAMEIIQASDPERVFTHWIPDAHSIAEIVLHLTAWTEEASERLSGGDAKIPLRGDWPVVLQANLKGWQSLVEDFRSAHTKLMKHISNFSFDEWESKIIDHRNGQAEGISYAELLNGIIQHLAYHSGQIALLQKNHLR